MVGRHTIARMLRDLKPGLFYSNHSLRKSGPTRLFQAGVDRKIIKEFTGHVSDVVNRYQITSLRRILHGEKQKEIAKAEECTKLEVKVKSVKTILIGSMCMPM